MIMGIDQRTVAAAAMIAFLGVFASARPGDAQTIVNEKGLWQITIPANADSAQDKFSLSTRAVNQMGAKFSLSCRKNEPLYYFAVENARPASTGPEEVARFSIRVTNQDPIWFQTAWRDRGIEVREGAHQTAFSIIMMLLTEASPATVEFSVGGGQSGFSLDGFADLTADLRRHCGHEFATQRGR